MNEKILYELGVDINREWEFKDGDLQLTYYDENMKQAIYNRLSCWLGSLDIFYINYGSELEKYLGYKNKNSVHEYIRLEIEKRIGYDPRVRNVECTVNKYNTHGVNVHLTLTFLNGDTFEDNFVIKINTEEIING